jgi:alpha-ketoglutarate-dependent taurine dioxygenase
MPPISTPAALKSSYRLDVLEPFGLQINGTGPDSIFDIDPNFLDRLMRHEKLLVLRGFAKAERTEFLQFCRAYPERKVLEWSFGPVMEMREESNPQNYLFSREPVPFHWDGAFYTVPTFLMFNCIQAPTEGAGGETLFCDTEKVWLACEKNSQREWEKVELTYSTAKLAHYGGTFKTPLVQNHPVTGRPILRFAEPVTTELNPVALRIDGISESEQPQFLNNLVEKIYSPQFCYQHQWEENDFLMADNHALIHGRRAFDKDCPRHLRRIQLV